MIPLGITRIYFHFVVGIDRRHREKIVGVDRRGHRTLIRQLGFMATLGLGLLVTALILIMVANNLTEEDLLGKFYLRDFLEWIQGYFQEG